MRSAKYLVMILLWPAALHAATINAASCQRADVLAAVTAAHDGDTVIIPAGTCTWTTNLTITNKILTIQGAGIGQTTIVDGVSKDNFPNVPQVLVWTTKDGGLTRLTGMTFQGGTIPDSYNKAMVAMQGTSKTWRLDHCRFVTTQTSGLHVYDFTYGVIDHNVFDLGDWRFGIYVFHGAWNNQGAYGDGSWADATYHGTNKAIFIEDNVFTAQNISVAHDGWAGERVVFRYNTLNNALFANHGTESPERWRGARSFEVYNNTFTFRGAGSSYSNFLDIRAGVGVIYNNTGTTANGAFVTDFTELAVFRANQAYNPWGMCNGLSLWDGNTDVYGYPCLDQIGRGRSDLIAGDNPAPVAWPHQAVEPTYCWNNTKDGVANSPCKVRHPLLIVLGRDFFNSAKPGYTPYAYPHPLVTGAGPAPPNNLRIVR